MNLKKDIIFGIKIGIVIFLGIYCAVSFCNIYSFLKETTLIADIVKTVIGALSLFYLKLALIFLANGIIFGAATALFWYVLTNGNINRLRPLKKYLLFALSIIIGLIFMMLKQIIYQPSFFNRYLNDKGRALQKLQHLITSNIHLVFLDVCFYLFIAIFVVFTLMFFINRGKKVLVVGLIILSLSGFCVLLISKSRDREGNKGFNVLILCIETLRPDHLSCNGYHRNTSPNIDMLAKNGANFNNAFVNIARTSPSITSLLTGCYSKKHGISNIFPDAFDSKIKIDTLPRIFRRHGYRTIAIGDYSAEMFNSIDYGFETIICPPPISVDILIQRRIMLDFIVFMSNFNNKIGRFLFPVLKIMEGNDDPATLNNELKNTLANYKGNKKFFIFSFFSAPHIPFNPVFPYYKLYTDPLYAGKNKYSCRYDDISKISEYVEKKEIDKAEIQQLIDLYDGAIRSVDDQIGDLIRYLKKQNLFEKTIIIITGDHGEDFYENDTILGHGLWFKGNDNANRIPIIIYNPHAHNINVKNESLVRNIDIMPTLLDMLDINAPEDMDGISLLPLINKEKDALNLGIFCETGLWFNSESTLKDEKDAILYPSLEKLLTYEQGRGNIIILKSQFRDIVDKAKHRMYRNDEWKLVYIPQTTGETYRLFNIKKDPNSINNLINKEPEKFEELKNILLNWYFGSLSNDDE